MSLQIAVGRMRVGGDLMPPMLALRSFTGA